MKTPLKDLVAENVSRLSKKEGFNSVSLGKKTGLSQRTTYRLLNPAHDGQNPTLSTLEAIAGSLKTQTWKLLYPSMPTELFADPGVEDLLGKYAQCSPENRKRIINQIAEIAERDQLEKRLKQLEE